MSCDCGRLQISDVTREVKFLSHDNTNPNTNLKTLTTLTLTLIDLHGTFESFCVPVFCDFVQTYSWTIDGEIDNSLFLWSYRTGTERTGRMIRSYCSFISLVTAISNL